MLREMYSRAVQAYSRPSMRNSTHAHESLTFRARRAAPPTPNLLIACIGRSYRPSVCLQSKKHSGLCQTKKVAME